VTGERAMGELEKIEKTRVFLAEVMTYYLIIMVMFGAPTCVFVLCPLSFVLQGLPQKFIDYFIAGGIWFFLLVTVAVCFLEIVLTIAKMLLAGYTHEEANFLKGAFLMFLGYGIFFVIFTYGLFVSG
jgi:hypothetical protein